jgi:hypothetical protein
MTAFIDRDKYFANEAASHAAGGCRVVTHP